MGYDHVHSIIKRVAPTVVPISKKVSDAVSAVVNNSLICLVSIGLLPARLVLGAATAEEGVRLDGDNEKCDDVLRAPLDDEDPSSWFDCVSKLLSMPCALYDWQCDSHLRAPKEIRYCP